MDKPNLDESLLAARIAWPRATLADAAAAFRKSAALLVANAAGGGNWPHEAVPSASDGAPLCVHSH